MKVSLLTPSRNRVDLLRQSLNSVDSPRGNYEVLVAVDDDDPALGDYIELIKAYKKAKLFVMPSHGYQNLHEYYNELAKHAKGDWLMLWNDDAIMETRTWVKLISPYDSTIPQVLNPWKEQDNLFPLISRAWYEAVGHFSQNTHADSWVQQVADIDGRSVYVPGISIKHYGEELNDETHTRVREVVRQSSEAYRRMGEQRMEDARKISNWIGEHQS